MGAANTVQAHSASFLSQQILVEHLGCDRGWINPGVAQRGCKQSPFPQKLTSGGEETPVMMRCDKFSSVDVERLVGAGREELMWQ